MADYHIYLHSDSPDNSLDAKFKPQAVRDGDSEGSGKSTSSSPFQTAIKKGYNFVKSGGNVINPAVQKIASAVPIVALVIAALKITDHIVSTTVNNIYEYTGNIEGSLHYNNFKNSLSWATNPISQTINMAKRQLEIRKNNQRIEEQNKLIGNSTFKHITKGL